MGECSYANDELTLAAGRKQSLRGITQSGSETRQSTGGRLTPSLSADLGGRQLVNERLYDASERTVGFSDYHAGSCCKYARDSLGPSEPGRFWASFAGTLRACIASTSGEPRLGEHCCDGAIARAGRSGSASAKPDAKCPAGCDLALWPGYPNSSSSRRGGSAVATGSPGHSWLAWGFEGEHDAPNTAGLQLCYRLPCDSQWVSL